MVAGNVLSFVAFVTKKENHSNHKLPQMQLNPTNVSVNVLAFKNYNRKLFQDYVRVIIFSSLRKQLQMVSKRGHVGNRTKRTRLLPWLVRGMTAVKHKETADTPSFQSVPNPTLCPAHILNVCTHSSH